MRLKTSLPGGPLLGVHVSVAGGLHKGIDEARRHGCGAIQLFTRNQQQWKARPLDDEEIRLFREARDGAGHVRRAFAHDSYLINLASPDPALRKRSIDAFLEEVRRSEALGLDYVVTHPGSHVGAGEEEGLKRIAEAFSDVHRRTPGFRVRILIETAAGQGTALGRRFEELAWILLHVDGPERMGVCFDTCHVFAAGYDISTEAGYAKTMQSFDDVIGLRRLLAFHLNDSKKGLGCRVDRHEHIGKGSLGLTVFRCLMNDPRFIETPMVLETPKDDDMDRVNLAVLRSLGENARMKSQISKPKSQQNPKS